LGGWSQVLSLRQSKEKMLCDARILGSDKFVERIVGEADAKLKSQISVNERSIGAARFIREACMGSDVNVEEIKGGSRRGAISDLRGDLAVELVSEYGISLAEAGRQLGVSTSAISKILERRKSKSR